MADVAYADSTEPRVYMSYFLGVLSTSIQTAATAQNAAYGSEVVMGTVGMASTYAQGGMNATGSSAVAGYGPTYYIPQYPPIGMSATLTQGESVNTFSGASPDIFAVMTLEDSSPPLSEVELADLVESENELRQGKGKRFRDIKSLLADLNED